MHPFTFYMKKYAGLACRQPKTSDVLFVFFLLFVNDWVMQMI